MNFLDVKTDFAFKKVFGSEKSKPLLISFLNSILYKDEPVKITDLNIVDPYNIPMLRGMKDSFVDVKAVLSNNSLVIIEMQVLSHEGFEKRILYNAAKNYSIQLDKGEGYTLLNPVIALTIVDFIMFDDIDKHLTRFKLLEKDDFIKYSDDLEMIFIELPKFNKELKKLQGIEEEWVWFLKNSGSLEYVPETLSREVKNAFDISNEANMSKEELEIQHKKREFIYIQKKSLTKALNDGLKTGIKRGLKQGIEQGKIEGKIEDAKKMLKEGLEIGLISKITGLSIDEIKNL